MRRALLRILDIAFYILTGIGLFAAAAAFTEIVGGASGFFPVALLAALCLGVVLVVQWRKPPAPSLRREALRSLFLSLSPAAVLAATSALVLSKSSLTPDFGNLEAVLVVTPATAVAGSLAVGTYVVVLVARLNRPLSSAEPGADEE